MSKIERYDVEGHGCWMKPCDDGDYVLYSEIAALEQRIDQLERAGASLLEDSEYFTKQRCGECGQSYGNGTDAEQAMRSVLQAGSIDDPRSTGPKVKLPDGWYAGKNKLIRHAKVSGDRVIWHIGSEGVLFDGECSVKTFIKWKASGPYATFNDAFDAAWHYGSPK